MTFEEAQKHTSSFSCQPNRESALTALSLALVGSRLKKQNKKNII